MSIPDDLPPSATRSSRTVQKVIGKLQNKHELQEYIEQLTAFNAHHLTHVTEEMRHNLKLQGLDEEDLHEIHEFLLVSFDGDLMKTEDRKLTEERAHELSGLIST
ncbi:hypothetical protein ACFL3T_04105 [Patescibacteria group bacterium]